MGDTVFAVLMIPFATWLLWRTRFGLRLRICRRASRRRRSARHQHLLLQVRRCDHQRCALPGIGGAFIASQELSGIYKEGQTTGEASSAWPR